ncbi:hypothetical protein, partial [Streptomyces sp. NPDC001658]
MRIADQGPRLVRGVLAEPAPRPGPGLFVVALLGDDQAERKIKTLKTRNKKTKKVFRIELGQ